MHQSKKNTMIFWQIVKRFLEPVKENKKMFLKALIGYCIGPIGAVITVIFLEKITYSIEQGDQGIFKLYILGFICFIVVNHIIHIFVRRDWDRVVLETKGNALFYDKYIKRFLRLDGVIVEKIGTGKMIAIINKGFNDWRDALDRLFHQGITAIVFFVFALISIYSLLGGIYVFIFVVLFVVIQIILYYVNKGIVKIRNQGNNILNENTRSLVRIIMSKFEILQAKKEDKEIGTLKKQINDCYEITKKRSLGIELIFFFPKILIDVSRILIFMVIGFGVFNNTSTYSELVLFTGALGLMDTAIKTSTHLFKDVAKKFVAVKKLRDTFDEIPLMTQYDEGRKFIYKEGDIKVENISFGYNQGKKIIKNFSLRLQGGKKAALVGPSGGGKTTLIKLLAGYISPDRGEVSIDGQKLSEVSLKSYYKHIGYLTQDPSVFDGTIRENLAYALEVEPSKDQIDEVIKLSRCEFIYDFKDGLDTEIGERGVRLSGGQKQRLAIAKIMLKNPNIILLDEPTSALDSVSEQKISEALHNLFKGKTVIIVAHRLQTVKEADEIIVLQGGQIIERGTHTSLKKKNGVYKQMLDLQTSF